MSRGTLTVSGGTVTGGSATGNGGGIYMGWFAKPLGLSGSALIYGNGGSDVSMSSNSTNYVALGNWAGNGEKGALKISRLDSADGTVLVKPEGVTFDANTLALFASADSACALALSEGQIVLKTAE